MAAAVQAELNGHGAPAAAEPEAPVTRPLAKPPVRKLAKDLGVDLASVVPTGKDGIITRGGRARGGCSGGGGCSGSGSRPPTR